MRHDFFPPPHGPFKPGSFYKLAFPNGGVITIKAYSEGWLGFLTKNGEHLKQPSPSYTYSLIEELATITEITESEALQGESFDGTVYKIGGTHAKEFNYEHAVGKIIHHDHLKDERPAVQINEAPASIAIHYLVPFPYRGNMERCYIHEDDLVPLDTNKKASFSLDKEGY